MSFFIKVRVDDGNWHKIRILRKRRIGILQIDRNKPIKAKSPKGGSVLNSDGTIWIGMFNTFVDKLDI